MPKLFLFDIDQTILHTGGADIKAMNMAFEEMFGVSEAFASIKFAGRCDLAIVGEALRHWKVNHDNSPEVISRFKEEYLKRFRAILKDWTKIRLMPGIPHLLATLYNHPEALLGLSTGNFREAAFIKLRHYGLDQYFNEGGFGGDSEDRKRIVALAIERMKELMGPSFNKEEVFVIGDSPADILSGQANGVHTIAVATGYNDVDELASFKPTLLYPDLSDTEAFLKAVFPG